MTNKEKLEAFRDALINNLEGNSLSDKVVDLIHAIIDINFLLKDMPD